MYDTVKGSDWLGMLLVKHDTSVVFISCWGWGVRQETLAFMDCILTVQGFHRHLLFLHPTVHMQTDKHTLCGFISTFYSCPFGCILTCEPFMFP